MFIKVSWKNVLHCFNIYDDDDNNNNTCLSAYYNDSEGSCDTEDWSSNDAENSVLITGINYILKYINRKLLF